MDNKELIKELEELRDIKNYSQSELMNTGYRTAILDALDLFKKYDLLHDVSESFNSDLRNKFFKECTDPSPNSGKNAGIRKVNMTAHDLFEWFKSNVR